MDFNPELFSGPWKRSISTYRGKTISETDFFYIEDRKVENVKTRIRDIIHNYSLGDTTNRRTLTTILILTRIIPFNIRGLWSPLERAEKVPSTSTGKREEKKHVVKVLANNDYL